MQISCPGYGPFKNGKGIIENTDNGVRIIKKGVAFGGSLLKTVVDVSKGETEGYVVPYSDIRGVWIYKAGFFDGHNFIQVAVNGSQKLTDSMKAIGDPACFVFDKKDMPLAERFKAEVEARLV